MQRTKMTLEDKIWFREMYLHNFQISVDTYLEFDFAHEESRIRLIRKAHEELKEKLAKVEEEYKALNPSK